MVIRLPINFFSGNILISGSISLKDERSVNLVFTAIQDKTSISEEFETEHTHPADQQKFGWQSILNNFKSYVETSLKSEKTE